MREEKSAWWRKLVISGGVFCLDAYDLFVINLVMKVMDQDYPQTAVQKSLISSVALFGAMLGQLLFGVMGDVLGRKRTFFMTVMLVVGCTILSGLVVDLPWFSIYSQLALVRFFLGIGIGGEYPMSATVGSEGATALQRGRVISQIFAFQGVGSCMAAATVLFLLSLGAPNWLVWRLALTATAPPAAAIAYMRYCSVESARFQQSIQAADRLQAATGANKAQHRLSLLCHPQALVTLVGTAGAWFIFDIAFYSNNLFNATITAAMGLGSDVTSLAVNANLLALMAMPGYLLTIVTTERITRKNLQLLGFLALGFLYVLLGCGMAWLSSYSGALIFTYGLTFFFSNFGPNSTTFIVPGEAPQIKTCVRSTSHGLSAAFGKLGAVLGTSVLTPLVERYGLPTVLVVCGVLSFAGLLWTLLFVPQYRTQDLEEADRTEQQAAEHAAALLTHADKEPEVSTVSYINSVLIN